MFLKPFITISSSFIYPIISKVYQKWLPPVCILCSHFTRHTFNLCLHCQSDLPILPYHCPQCAQFLFANGGEETHHNNLTCGTCLQNPPPFDRTYALFPYEPPITQLVIHLKFRHQLSHAKALGELFIEKIRQTWYKNIPFPDLIIPIPLHPHRLRERGFNQAVEIAKPIAKSLSIPLDVHGAMRIKKTVAQSGLSAAARKQNIAHAFVMNRDYSGLTIAVIDDVITTGHTIMEFCKTLKQHGAKKIDVWCAARRG